MNTSFFKSQLIHLILGSFILMAIGCQQEGSSSPEGFEIHPDFNLILAASEPLIYDPVDLEFDEHGDAYVLEMPGYPNEDEESRLRILQDTDGDGLFDASSLFAEELELASSIMPYNKGFLVAAPPYLLYLKDTDGDKKADERIILMSGFSTGNLQHNYNGLTFGLDGWIYAANGGNSGAPFWWGDSSSVLSLRGDDFRFHLASKKLERLGASSGGYELGIDEYGRIFETHNLEHISQLVYPSRYNGATSLQPDNGLLNISDHEENGLARIYPIGEQESRVNHPEQSGYFSGACGITYYGGGQFGSPFDQTLWIADVVLNLIHIDKITLASSAHQASRVIEGRDFLAGSDRAFRPVNMTVGPDGSMYVVDMYRKVIEHPEWIPDEIEQSLDLNAGKEKGRIYKITRKNGAHNPFNTGEFQSFDGLVTSLEHPNQWVRNTAHRLLIEQDLTEQEVKQLQTISTSVNPFGRLHAMWIIAAKGHVGPDLLTKWLSDEDPGVLENALIISEDYIAENPVALQQCIQTLTHPNQRVRMQAALSLSTIAETSSYPSHKNSIMEALLQAAKMATDEWNVNALTLAAGGNGGELATALLSSPDYKNNQDLIIALSRGMAQNDAQLSSLMTTLARLNDATELQTKIISTLADQSITVNAVSKLTVPLALIEQQGDPELIAACARLRHSLDLKQSAVFLALSKEAIARVEDSNLPVDIRLKQMALVQLLPYHQKSSVLYHLLSNKESLQLQEAALRQLWESGAPEIGHKLVEKWPELGPSSRRSASDILLYKEQYHDALLTGLEDGIINIGEMNFDLERRRTLLWWTDNERTKERAKALFSDAGVVNRKEVIEKMKAALSMNGSVPEGEKVFEQLCAQCHIYGTQGVDAGPVLTEINRKSKESLLYDILDPNAAVDTRYINHKLETIDGALHIGMVDNETDSHVTIKKMGGASVTIPKGDIKSFTSLGTSMMLEGLEANMSLQDMANLLTFLQEAGT